VTHPSCQNSPILSELTSDTPISSEPAHLVRSHPSCQKPPIEPHLQSRQNSPILSELTHLLFCQNSPIFFSEITRRKTCLPTASSIFKILQIPFLGFLYSAITSPSRVMAAMGRPRLNILRLIISSEILNEQLHYFRNRWEGDCRGQWVIL
jgi:hypothetical protein